MPLPQDALSPDRYTLPKAQGSSLPRAPPLTAQPSHPQQNTFPGAPSWLFLTMNSLVHCGSALVPSSSFPPDSSPQPASSTSSPTGVSTFQQPMAEGNQQACSHPDRPSSQRAPTLSFLLPVSPLRNPRHTQRPSTLITPATGRFPTTLHIGLVSRNPTVHPTHPTPTHHELKSHYKTRNFKYSTLRSGTQPTGTLTLCSRIPHIKIPSTFTQHGCQHFSGIVYPVTHIDLCFSVSLGIDHVP